MHSIFHTAKYFLKVINYSQLLQSTVKFLSLANFCSSQGRTFIPKIKMVQKFNFLLWRWKYHSFRIMGITSLRKKCWDLLWFLKSIFFFNSKTLFSGMWDPMRGSCSWWEVQSSLKNYLISSKVKLSCVHLEVICRDSATEKQVLRKL